MDKSKIKLLSSKIVDKNTKEDELLDVLLKNRGLDKDFFKLIKVKDIKAANFGIKKTDFEKVVKILKKAIDKQEKILIYGDYDVDGITSTSILWKAIYKLNKNVMPLIPDRQKDGYGINLKTVERFCQLKNFWPDMLIMVDNGIVAQNEIKKIKKKIKMVMVIDHHQKNKQKIEIDGMVYSSETTASILAYLVAREIDSQADLGLAVLGLIADLGSMANVYNRILATEGIRNLNKRQNKGIDELLKTANWGENKIDEWTIGFVIGPRINAAGRMGDATRALRLLSFDDKKMAQKLANELESENKNRQTEERKILNMFLEKNYDNQKIIVQIEKIQPGIIGLIAGKICEKFYKPVIIVTNIDRDIYKGSARSVDGFDITKFLRKEDNLFESLGGHSGAAGFSIKKENWSKWLKKVRSKKIKFVNKKKMIVSDAKMKLEGLTIKNFEVVEKFRPFGQGNKTPLFLFEAMRVIDKKAVGKDGSHLKLKVDDPLTSKLERVIADGIAFGKNGQFKDLKMGDLINLTAEMNLNEYGGKRRVELMVKDMWL